jgi:hypothetical protein
VFAWWTKCKAIVENSNKKARRAEHLNRDGNVISTASVMHQVRLCGDTRNAIEQRGIKHVLVTDSDLQYGAVKHNEWAKAIQPKNTPLPKDWHADNVTKSTKPYTTTSQPKRRDSIAALQALLWLVQTSQADKASKTWQTCVLAPRCLSIHASGSFEAWLTIATAYDAARVCRLVELPDSTGARRYVPDFNAPWEWLTIVDVRCWLQIPFEWCINESCPDAQLFKHIFELGHIAIRLTPKSQVC